MPTLYISIGAPCSGKTTWAEEFLKSAPNTYRINRDEVRRMLKRQSYLNAEGETLVTEIEHSSILAILESGFDCILDNTNCNYNRLMNTIDNWKSYASIKFRVFEEPLDVLYRRNQERSVNDGYPPIPEAVINRFYSQLQHLKTQFDFQTIKQQEEEEYEQYLD